MVTQSGDPNNKSKPAFKIYCSYCHKNNHSISNCYQKQRDVEYQDIKIKDQELLNNPLYNTFVVNPGLPKKLEMKTQMLTLLMTMIVVNTTKNITMIDTDIMIDIAVTVEIIPKIVIDLTLDKDITITPEVHIDLDTKLLQTKNSISISIQI